MDAKVRLAALATRQFGVVARRQLGALGISNSVVSEWTTAGLLHRLHPAVYAVGHTGLSSEGWLAAALLYAGPGAALSHTTAAWWLGLASARESTIELSTPRRCRSRPGVGVHGRRDRPRWWHRGLPVGAVPDVLLDYATVATTRDVRRAVAEAEYQGWLDLEVTKAALGHGRPGSARLRRALAAHEPRLAMTRSEFERRLLGLCETRGIPLPAFNVTVAGHLVDALWADERVIVEVDGQRGHASWAQIQRDRERDLALRAAGYLVLRYGWRQLLDQPRAVAADLSAALRGRR